MLIQVEGAMAGKTPNPEKEAAGLAFTLHEPFPGVSTQWDMTCNICEVRRSRYLRRIRVQGCMECAGTSQGVWRAEKDLRDAGFEPLGEYHDARTNWEVRHTAGCGQSVVVQMTNIRRGVGCGRCAGRQDKEPKAVEDFLGAGLKPIDPYPGRNNVPWRAECQECYSVVAPRLANVRTGRGCRECGGRAPLTEAKAAAVMKTAGFEPLDRYPGKRTAQWCCCHTKCGREVTPTYKSAKRGIGCRHCDMQSFNYDAPAYLYVLTNDEFGAVKIGVGGALTKRDRLKILGRDGWESFRLETFDTGEAAIRIERRVLNALKNEMGLEPYVPKYMMRFNGWTETFAMDDISEDSLWDLVRSHIEQCTRDAAGLG